MRLMVIATFPSVESGPVIGRLLALLPAAAKPGIDGSFVFGEAMVSQLQRIGGIRMTRVRERRATVHDLARAAGVSLATVDRVLNRRPGVRPATISRVEAAIEALDYRRDVSASLLARAREIDIVALLPDGENRFMQHLAMALEREGRARAADRLRIHLQQVRAMDGNALARAIDGLQPKSCDCAIAVATDTDAVRAAVERAAQRGIDVITLVSDLHDSRRRHFVGIDNLAAGGTAAALLGRFCSATAKIGLIAGSLELRDHRERLEGFEQTIRAKFPGIRLKGPLEGHDEATETAAATTRLIAEHSDLEGLYSIGAGNSGLIAALHQTGRAGKLHVVAHELTDTTRQGLRDGAIDVILDQNPEGEVRAALEIARQIALRADPAPDAFSIELGIFFAENLR
jgi:LacI family transcriptional regulator